MSRCRVRPCDALADPAWGSACHSRGTSTRKAFRQCLQVSWVSRSCYRIENGNARVRICFVKLDASTKPLPVSNELSILQHNGHLLATMRADKGFLAIVCPLLSVLITASCAVRTRDSYHMDRERARDGKRLAATGMLALERFCCQPGHDARWLTYSLERDDACAQPAEPLRQRLARIPDRRKACDQYGSANGEALFASTGKSCRSRPSGRYTNPCPCQRDSLTSAP